MLELLQMKKPLYYLYLTQLAFITPSIIYWLDSVDYSLGSVNILNFFPVLGLTAFTMMWFHLMIAQVRHKYPDMFNYKKFYRNTSNIVLVLIILHPVLLITKSINAGNSYINYAGDTGRPFIIFGTLSLFSFLIYEVIERIREKSIIKRNWPYVVAMNRIGFILIFIHGLKLGHHLQSGPLRILWLLYGLTALVYFVLAFNREIRSTKNN